MPTSEGFKGRPIAAVKTGPHHDRRRRDQNSNRPGGGNRPTRSKTFAEIIADIAASFLPKRRTGMSAASRW